MWSKLPRGGISLRLKGRSIGKAVGLFVLDALEVQETQKTHQHVNVKRSWWKFSIFSRSKFDTLGRRGASSLRNIAANNGPIWELVTLTPACCGALDVLQ